MGSAGRAAATPLLTTACACAMLQASFCRYSAHHLALACAPYACCRPCVPRAPAPRCPPPARAASRAALAHLPLARWRLALRKACPTAARARPWPRAPSCPSWARRASCLPRRTAPATSLCNPCCVGVATQSWLTASAGASTSPAGRACCNGRARALARARAADRVRASAHVAPLLSASHAVSDARPCACRCALPRRSFNRHYAEVRDAGRQPHAARCVARVALAPLQPLTPRRVSARGLLDEHQLSERGGPHRGDHVLRLRDRPAAVHRAARAHLCSLRGRVALPRLAVLPRRRGALLVLLLMPSWLMKGDALGSGGVGQRARAGGRRGRLPQWHAPGPQPARPQRKSLLHQPLLRCWLAAVKCKRKVWNASHRCSFAWSVIPGTKTHEDEGKTEQMLMAAPRSGCSN